MAKVIIQKEQVFLAALSGILANPNFFGAVMQGDPKAAIEFAKSVVKELKTVD